MAQIVLDDDSILFADGTRHYKNVQRNEFYVYNANHWTPVNGGQCCLWTVPAGTTSIQFEILSGGGPGGSSGGDYDHGVGGAGGNYTMKSLKKSGGAFQGGCTYTICAAGTSDCSCCCSCNMNCRHGCVSYVTGPGLTNFCAIGGMGGTTSWDMTSNCYNCHIGNTQCSVGNYNAGWANYSCNTPTYGGDVEFRGTTGGFVRQYDCCSQAYSTAGAPSGPFTAPHGSSGKGRCVGNWACCSAHSAFPGGGGAGHATDATDACWGGFGAGGLVKVTYS